MPWIECIVNAGKAGYTTRTIHAYCEKAAKRIIGYENEINWYINIYFVVPSMFPLKILISANRPKL